MAAYVLSSPRIEPKNIDRLSSTGLGSMRRAGFLRPAMAAHSCGGRRASGWRTAALCHRYACHRRCRRSHDRRIRMREIGHFIGGKAVTGGSGRFADVFNPNTGEVQARVALAKHSEVEHAIALAQAAQPAWAATNPQRRARVMFKFLD